MRGERGEGGEDSRGRDPVIFLRQGRRERERKRESWKRFSPVFQFGKSTRLNIHHSRDEAVLVENVSKKIFCCFGIRFELKLLTVGSDRDLTVLSFVCVCA